MMRALSTIAALLFLLPCFGQGQSGRPMVSVDTVADLVARKPVPNERVLLSGLRTAGDYGAQRIVRHDPASVAATNLGCVFGNAGTGRYLAEDCESGEVDVRWFGATGDGVTDDTAALQAAMDYASGSYLAVSKQVLIPAGNYLVSGPLRMTNDLSNPFRLSGSGPQVSVITQSDTNSPTIVYCGYGRQIDNLRITYSTASSSADAAGILFATRDGVGSGFGELSNIALYNTGVGIGSTINYATVPIGAAALAGSTNIALSYVTDTTGPFIFREGEMIVPLAAGGTQTVIVQGLSGTNVLFQPALTGDSTTGSVTIPGLAQNMSFSTIKIVEPGHCAIYWRTGDSGSVWENCYLNGGNKTMGSGVAWLIGGASQMSLSGVNNVENFGCTMAAVVLNNYSTSVDSLHIENCKLFDTYASLLRVGEDCAVDLQSIELANYWTATNVLETALFRVGDRSRITIGDLDIRNAQGITNFSASQFYLVKDSGSATASIKVRNAYLAQDSAIRYRALVHPLANQRVLKELGNLIPPGMLASFRNVRLDSTGDKTIYLHNKGVPESVVFSWPSINASTVAVGLNQLASGVNHMLGTGLHLSGMTAWTNSTAINLGVRPLLTQDLYLSVSNSIAVSVVANTGLQRRRYGTTVGQLSSVCEIVTPTAHGLHVGELVFIGNADDATFNGTWEVLSVPSTNTFRYYSYGPVCDLVADTDLSVTLYPTVTVSIYGDSLGQIAADDYSHGLTTSILGFGTNAVLSSAGVLNIGLTGGNSSNFFRGDGVFTNIVPIAPTNNGAYVLFVTNGVASWIAHP